MDGHPLPSFWPVSLSIQEGCSLKELTTLTSLCRVRQSKLCYFISSWSGSACPGSDVIGIHFMILSKQKNVNFGASLVVQWLRICLPMHGTRVRALVWENPTCRGATRSVSHNTEPARLEPVLRNKRGRDSERPAHHDGERPLLAATRESPRTETKTTQHSHK